MDSLTQFSLGASVALATVGQRSAPRTAAWKVALIGGLVGTLPDLDAFIDFGDAVSNMIRHRAETHGLFYLTLASPLIGTLIAKLCGGPALLKRWWLTVWLIFMTHVGIDLLTIYGTQLAQPFSDYPFGIGSLFVIDPLYTLPLIAGIIGTTLLRGHTKWKWNVGGLVLSSTYIAWSLGAHQHATQIARQSLPISDQPLQLLVTAAPLNTVLWRALVITPNTYYEGWYSLLDPEPRFSWKAYPRNRDIIERYQDQPDARRIASFSHGFFNMELQQDRLYITDLRLGLEPYYSFRFDLGKPEDSYAASQRAGGRPDLKTGLPWLWNRIQGNTTSLADYQRALAPQH